MPKASSQKIYHVYSTVERHAAYSTNITVTENNQHSPNNHS